MNESLSQLKMPAETAWLFCSENKESHFNSISQDPSGFHTWVRNPANGTIFQPLEGATQLLTLSDDSDLWTEVPS